MMILPKLQQYGKWLDLSWLQHPIHDGVFFDRVALELVWPGPVFARGGQPQDVLYALGVSTGDYVVLPNLSPWYWAVAVKSVGADCLLIDAHRHNWQVDLDLLEEFLMNHSMLDEKDELILKKDSRVIRAMIAPHLLGGMCDMERLQFIARRFHLQLGEDITQALGSRWNGQPAGSFGALGYCDFAYNPLLPFGQPVLFRAEAGRITTDPGSAEVVSPSWQLLDHLGRQLAPKLNDILAAFRATEDRYRQSETRQWMGIAPQCRSNGLATAFLAEDRTELEQLKSRITTPLYLQPPFDKCLYLRREDWSGKLYERGRVLPAGF